ncbi:hypothetical protein [Sphingomonas jaspsi]|uniref:hypothetical protein n=1 Tax=Sphingomonas jaspsi TaxID=392409 RepID=UPI0004B7050B|nr:hypothetical protein [Sphingomonas jaspsi]
MRKLVILVGGAMALLCLATVVVSVVVALERPPLMILAACGLNVVAYGTASALVFRALRKDLARIK